MNHSPAQGRIVLSILRCGAAAAFKPSIKLKVDSYTWNRGFMITIDWLIVVASALIRGVFMV